MSLGLQPCAPLCTGPASSGWFWTRVRGHLNVRCRGRALLSPRPRQTTVPAPARAFQPQPVVPFTVTAEGRGACADEGLEVDPSPPVSKCAGGGCWGVRVRGVPRGGVFVVPGTRRSAGGRLDPAVHSHSVCLRVYFRLLLLPFLPPASPEDRGLSVTWEVLLLLMTGRGPPLGAPAVTAVEDTQRRLHPALPWV